jgi:hypothetical protein
MVSEARYRTIVRAGAIYDLIVTAPFTTPWTLALALSTMGWAQAALGLSGEVPAYSTGVALFANLMGSLVLVWSSIRILWPEPWLGRADALARGLFSLWMIYALVRGATPVIGSFLAFELIWMTAQFLPYRRAEPTALQQEPGSAAQPSAGTL